MSTSKRPAGALYILPNLFTAFSIFIGVLSIISAIGGNYEKAAWLIMLALLFDGLDGRVARLTNTSSKFGAEFDSLADIIAFGAAPALLLFTYIGDDYGRYGVAVSALYVIFGAIRLARFNVMAVRSEPSVFIGVPIPTAAVFVAILVLLCEHYKVLHSQAHFMLGIVTIVAVLMVSNIRYPSFKKIDLHRMHMRRFFLIVVFVAMLLFLFPIEGFSLLFVSYILYGPLRALYMILTRFKRFKRGL